jgi:sugar O-acyltransferase (sialic acid O-acetyltransferase NeuD family)
MKDIIIIGAGDFSQEIRWLIERINQAIPTWNILGFVDDGISAGTDRDGISVLGTVDYLLNIETQTDVVLAIANGCAKESIMSRIKGNVALNFPVVIDPSAVVSEKAIICPGSVICAGAVVMPHALIEAFTHVNWNSTIGHDSTLEEYSTIFPGANVSGKVTIGRRSLVGTGASIIQRLSIVADVIIGAGSAVVKDISIKGTYVGVPATRKK